MIVGSGGVTLNRAAAARNTIASAPCKPKARCDAAQQDLGSEFHHAIDG